VFFRREINSEILFIKKCVYNFFLAIIILPLFVGVNISREYRNMALFLKSNCLNNSKVFFKCSDTSANE